MKKAKEYSMEIIETYIEKSEREALELAAQTLKDLFKESEEIEKTRHVTNYAPMLAILKEQHLKWVAICRKVNKEIVLLNLNERAFLDAIEQKMTMIYPNLMQIV
jgi:hypothetical protein